MNINDISSIKLGNQDVENIYFGSSLVWSYSPEETWDYVLSAADFEQGNISSSSGGNTSNSTRIRTIGFYTTSGNFIITGSAAPTDEEDILHWWVQGYRDEDLSESGRKYEGNWITGGTTPTTYDFSFMSAKTKYVRFYFRY